MFTVLSLDWDEVMTRKPARSGIRVAIAVAALAVFIGLWPISSVVAPEWKISVVDPSGNPVQDVIVRESYEHYSAEFHGHEEDHRPDSQGRVVFSEKKIRSPLVKRVFVTALSLTAGVHASFGPYCYVFAFGKNVESTDLSWSGSPLHMQSTIVVSSSGGSGSQ